MHENSPNRSQKSLKFLDSYPDVETYLKCKIHAYWLVHERLILAYFYHGIFLKSEKKVNAMAKLFAAIVPFETIVSGIFFALINIGCYNGKLFKRIVS